MKKRAISLFLILALVLTALAGCGEEKKDDPEPDEKDEQALATGLYEVSDEDDKLVGYLEVKKSKITVYDKDGEKEDTLNYEYNAKKERYELDDGELFGSETFTVEQSKKTLTLTTADDDEYTLEEIDELPGDDIEKTPKPERTDNPSAGSDIDEPEEDDYVKLPTGCYAVYEGRSLVGYMEVTNRTMTSYDEEGYEEEEIRYSYERDGTCTLEADYYELTVMFTYDRGDYYMSAEGEPNSVRLEPVDDIPVPDDSGTEDAYFIGDNGSIGLYAWLPEGLYDDLDINKEDEGLIVSADYYDSSIDSEILFYGFLISGDSLQEGIDDARESYDGNYGSDADLLYSFFRDSMLIDGLENGYLVDEYIGDVEYDVDEDEMTVNGQTWRYCDVYLSAEDGEAYISLMFWMEGDDMAMLIIGGISEDSDGAIDMYADLYSIIYSLELDT